jgi:hypothetical protein
MSKLDTSDPLQHFVMKAFIIYQDFTSATKANMALQHSAQYSDVRVQWNIRPWRVDMLKFPPTAAEALADATDAHLIVFAGCCTRSIPHCLQDWLDKWAGCRQIETAALAIFGGENTDDLSASAAPALSQFAERHGLSVIFDAHSIMEHGQAFPPEILLEHKLPQSPPPPQGLNLPNPDQNRRWGINE